MKSPKRQSRAWVLRLAALAALSALMVLSYRWMSATPTELQRVNLDSPLPPSNMDVRNASMEPGRVVELHTNKGEIDFVLFERDCPKTSARIVQLASDGQYDKIRFTRVEKNGLIQIEAPKKKMPPMRLELRTGLINTKGAVGMARLPNAPDSATSIFYILIEPWRHLDYDYTVFGRVIRGIGVAASIRKNDVITKATVRPLTDEDRKLFHEALQVEAERNTQ